MPEHPIPTAQANRFYQLLREHLNLDSRLTLGQITWDNEWATVEAMAMIPAQELIDLFNQAGQEAD